MMEAVGQKRAVVLLSGGLDSATVLAIARQQGYEIAALSFQYGQRHSVELEAARRLAAAAGVARHVVMQIDLRVFGGSSLTTNQPVPKGRDLSQPEAGIPSTYVPARNTIFLSFALAFAEVQQAADIFAGMNAIDYSGYPDCRPEYLRAFETLANLATRAGVEGTLRTRIHAPLISLSKAEIIRRGLELGVDYGATISCYDADPQTGAACGDCDSCQLRRAGFQANGVPDPTRYKATTSR
jgi:7-cyano-7-deazaguanine synthase